MFTWSLITNTFRNVTVDPKADLKLLTPFQRLRLKPDSREL